MFYDPRRWWPFTYDQIHVECAKIIRTSTNFESVVMPYTESRCGGKLYYRWDENNKSMIDTACDKCNKSFHPNQLELFKEKY